MKIETQRLESMTQALYNLLTDAGRELRVRWAGDLYCYFLRQYKYYEGQTDTWRGEMTLTLDPYALESEIKDNFLSSDDNQKSNYVKLLNSKVSVLTKEKIIVSELQSVLKLNVSDGTVDKDELIDDTWDNYSYVSTFVYRVDQLLDHVRRVENIVAENVETFCGVPVSTGPAPQPAQPGVKLQWNGTNDSLYDLIAQLSLQNTTGSTPLLGNTIEGLAQFLGDNVEGMPSVETIDRRIRAFREPQGEKPKRGRIELHINKDKP